MCDKLRTHILGSARCFCAIARSSFLHMQQQMPKYLVLSWSICQFACVGMLQSILTNTSTFHVLSLTKNCQALFSPLFFVLGGCCQTNENAPLQWSTMYIDYLGSSCQRQQQGRSCQSMQWILANQCMDLSELTLQPTIWKDSLIRYGRLCLAVIQPACGTCIGPLKACKEWSQM